LTKNLTISLTQRNLSLMLLTLTLK